MSRSSLARAFWYFWNILVDDLPKPEQEYRFVRDHVGHGPGLRKRLERAGLKDWRFDFAWPEPVKVAIELEGGTFTKGRHIRARGYSSDCEKYNAAQQLGWVVLRYTTDMINEHPAQMFMQIRKVYTERTLNSGREKRSIVDRV
jgi:very-short-patch-repair endonuclease